MKTLIDVLRALALVKYLAETLRAASELIPLNKRISAFLTFRMFLTSLVEDAILN
ncbi:MAG: hypothetical protein IJM82_04075 [Synergistaceae bacterium]|nr:hypothetical protein [Synergistaceae bacterium]MBQ7068321.1 hypothetical protein [Synergistaceae bacterium]MBR0076617.1 hypothetical protein [Synergistaceae bacterium]MBR0080993.1 hypothetical protein [Synergistaceae bacterium]MBR0233204.1 hypothetical protein [Synergistaceae bacterium]